MGLATLEAPALPDPSEDLVRTSTPQAEEGAPTKEASLGSDSATGPQHVAKRPLPPIWGWPFRPIRSPRTVLWVRWTAESQQAHKCASQETAPFSFTFFLVNYFRTAQMS